MTELPAEQNGHFPPPEEFDMGRAVGHAQNLIQRPDYSAHPDAALAPAFSSPDAHPLDPAAKATSDPELPEIARHEVETRDAIIAELKDAATLDSLTGLPNKATWIRRADAVMQNARPNQKFVTLFIDLGDFKALNDTHPRGHQQGDEFLQDVGTLIRQSVRSEPDRQDIVTRGNRESDDDDGTSRLGGDEFAIFAELTGNGPLTTEEKIDHLINRVRENFDAYMRDHPDLAQYGLFITIGHALRQPGETALQLLGRADASMYEEKRRQKAAIRQAGGRTHR